MEYTGIFHIPFFLRHVCPGYFSGIFQTNYHIPDFPNLCMSQIKFGIFWDIPWKMEYSRIWLICMSQILKWNIPKISKKKSMSQGRVKVNQALKLEGLFKIPCEFYTKFLSINLWFSKPICVFIFSSKSGYAGLTKLRCSVKCWTREIVILVTLYL